MAEDPGTRRGLARMFAGPRRLLWRAVRPFVETELSTMRAQHDQQEATLRAQYELKLTVLKKELIATNHRITWLEENGAGGRTKGRS